MFRHSFAPPTPTYPMLNFVFYPTNTALSVPLDRHFGSSEQTWGHVKKQLLAQDSQDMRNFGEHIQDPFILRARNSYLEDDTAVTEEDQKTTIEVLTRPDFVFNDAQKFRKAMSAMYFAGEAPICFVTGKSLAVEVARTKPNHNSIDNGLFLRADWQFLFESGHWTLNALDQQRVFQIVLGKEMQRNEDYRKYHGQALGLWHSSQVAKLIYKNIKKEHLAAQKLLFEKNM